jgi:large subunit ribosomal protein L25
VIRGHYLHLDFLALNLKEKVRTNVSIKLIGESPAIEEYGAVLMTGLSEIEVEALPADLIDSIELDVSILEKIGDSINVNDLVMPKGIECLVETNDMLVVATAPVLIEEEEEELEEGLEGEEGLEEGAEPEVIEKGKGEDEE